MHGACKTIEFIENSSSFIIKDSTMNIYSKKKKWRFRIFSTFQFIIKALYK